MTLTGAQVVAGFVVQDEDRKLYKEQVPSPQKIAVENIPGMSAIKVRWIVSSTQNLKVEVDSAKGGKATWKN